MRSRLVGRAREIEALAGALASSRLVTVVGTAGVGKTRLALEYAHALPPDGVVVADVTGARTIADVAAAADAERCAAARSDPTLLLLDACEGVVEHAAAHVAALLARAPSLRCLATSRRPLGLAGERILPIEPLALPSGAHEIEGAPSSALFLDRARHELGDLSVDDATATAIVDICRRLGGLPLAIELCARRLRVLSVTELAKELERGIDVLGAGHRDAAPRHRSLRAALAVSWEMLAPQERTALAQASVFRGRFTLAAAEHVLDLSSCPGAPSRVETLHALVDHSLVGRSTVPGATELSFRVYEGVRHFAAEELGDAKEPTLDRHEQYFLHRRDPGDGDDLVAAVQRALARPSVPARAPTLLPAALAANAALASRGAIALRLALLDAAIASRPSGAPTDLAWALLARAKILSDAGRAADARDDLCRAEELARGTPDARLRAALSQSLAVTALDEGRIDEGVERASDALALQRALGDRQAEAEARILLAGASRLSGDLDRARQEAERAASAASAAGAPRLARLAAVELGRIAHDAGDIVTAQLRFDAAIVGLPATDDDLAPALASGVALLRIEEGSAAGAFEAARAVLERSLRAHRASGAAALEAEALALVGLTDELDGRVAAARAGYEEAGARLQATARAQLEGLVLASLGRLEASSDRLVEARAALDEARSRLFATSVRSLVAVYDLCEAHLAVAEARAARMRGDERAAHAHAERARRALATDALPGAHVRLARLLLARDISALSGASSVREEAARPVAAPEDTFVVSASARWFSPPRGPRVSLDTRRALRLILRSLVEQREVSPGTPLDVEALVRAGWPGERVLHDAGTNRVYTAIAQLRREGLRDILLRRDEGYLLDPAVAVTREAD